MGKDWYDGCTESREWRLNHLYFINTKEQGIIRFKMNWAQQKFYDNLWTRNNILKARQLGMSTFVAILILDCCLFNNNFNAGIIDKTLPDAIEKMNKIKLAAECMKHQPHVENDHVEDEEDRKNIAAFSMTIASEAKANVLSQNATFANGSSIRVGTSLRGGTTHLLHISEFGSVAANNAKKASEIISGGMPTVPTNGVIIMESTHEGGKYGENYRMTKAAMENVGKQLSSTDYRFFFFPWWGQAEYALEDSTADVSELADYWRELESQHIKLSMAQKRWYLSQSKIYGFLTKREFPSTPEEAFANRVEGAIYGKQIDRLRAQGKVAAEFEWENMKPFYVSWDIGMSDYMAMWLIQPGGDGKYYVLDYYCNHNQPLAHYVQHVQKWERDYEMIVARHLLPHDAGHRGHDLVNGKSFESHLMDAGLKTTVLPRISSVWAGIAATRDLLSHCVFHERCSRSIVWETEVFMSGIDALENYQTGGLTANGTERREPLHDACSHGADAFRYFCEAVSQGLVSREGVREREALPRLAYKKKAMDATPGVPSWW